MTDKELLEAAAMAAGLTLCEEWDSSINGVLIGVGRGDLVLWNPLENDGDALRLAVKLKLLVDTDHGCAMPIHKSGASSGDWSDGRLDDDPFAATRLAIVRAAASMAKETV
jgi:hypothetical protein